MDNDEYLSSQWISGPAEIFRIMRLFLHQRTLLTLSVPSLRQHFSSVMLIVDPDNQFIIIDEPHPAHPMQDLLKHETMKIVIHSTHGARVIFRARLLDIGEDNGLPYYKITFPTEIRRSQRRSAYRVPLEKTRRLLTSLPRAGSEPLVGQLEDISAQGISLRCADRSVLLLAQNQRIPKCIIQLPRLELSCTLQIRHIKNAAKSNTFLVGGRFMDLNIPQQRLLEKTIAELQREVVRTHKRVRPQRHIAPVVLGR